MTFWQTQHSPMNQELSQVLQKMAFLLNRRSVPYRRPADTWQERLNLAMEDPGVVAGFSHTENFGACRRRERRSSYSDFHSMDG